MAFTPTNRTTRPSLVEEGRQFDENKALRLQELQLQRDLEEMRLKENRSLFEESLRQDAMAETLSAARAGEALTLGMNEADRKRHELRNTLNAYAQATAAAAPGTLLDKQNAGLAAAARGLSSVLGVQGSSATQGRVAPGFAPPPAPLSQWDVAKIGIEEEARQFDELLRERQRVGTPSADGGLADSLSGILSGLFGGRR